MTISNMTISIMSISKITLGIMALGSLIIKTLSTMTVFGHAELWLSVTTLNIMKHCIIGLLEIEF